MTTDAAGTAAFLRDAIRNPLYQRAGAVLIYGELAMISPYEMLRYNRLVDVNHNRRLTSISGGFPGRPMPVLRSTDHVGEHHRFEEIVVRYRKDVVGEADWRTAAHLAQEASRG